VSNNQKVLRSRLVFETKRNKEGKINKYKVQWVVKGYAQQQGIDYYETYAGVYKTAA
jgi:hypothetical protein